MDNPVGSAPLIVNRDGTIASADSEIRAVVMQVQEISYNRFFFIAKCDDELVQPVRGVIFHDVPKDRFATDLYHRFWAVIGFLGEPCPHSTCENRNFHSTPSRTL